MNPATLARLEGWLRPHIVHWLPEEFVVQLYSAGRVNFLKKLVKEKPEPYIPPKCLERKLWGIPFSGPLMNAAGMFKNGEGYDFVARIGAAGYMGGTTTANPRDGYDEGGFRTPFVPLPRSHGGLNKLGLPNDGDEAVSPRYSGIERVWGCPIVHSVALDKKGAEDLEALVKGMEMYRQVGVDVIELNESCPNTHKQDDDVYQRLKYVKENFIDRDGRRVPVVVKFSNDTKIAQVPQIMDMLFELGFSGVDFGNTSTAYAQLRGSVNERERALFDFFTRTFGGGFSGEALKQRSLLLCYAAVQYLREGSPSQEFHVWRTGGIGCARDLKESDEIRVSMNFWFTGFFERFAEHGFDVYRKLHEEYLKN